jgi:hypothetical protein
MVAYLRRHGWTITAESNTAIRAQDLMNKTPR